jgi:lysophospholipase L1-like esterase
LYTLDITLGDVEQPSATSLTIEARRHLLTDVSTLPGRFRSFSATVSVRSPEGQPTGQGGFGTPGLTLTFDGAAPRVAGLRVTTAAAPLRVFLVGDSTVCDQPAAPYTGWGQQLPALVGPGAVIENYADTGESASSFLATEALFPTLRRQIAPNDLVLIQFGHNDKRATAEEYRDDLTTMITQLRARGGVPVLVTPPVQRFFAGATLTPDALHVNGVGVDYPAQMRAVAADQGVPLIDLTAKSRALVESLGPELSKHLYLTQATDGRTDDTHFSTDGADRLAALVVQGVRELNLPLATYLR